MPPSPRSSIANQATDMGTQDAHRSGGPATVTAAVLRKTKGQFALEELELDAIRPNEARVRIVAVGVCHTDMVVRDGVYPLPMPIVLGHEGAGVVEAVGSAVTRVKPGDHVILSAASCGDCKQCLTGHGAYCENLFPQDFGGKRPTDGSTSLKTKAGEVISSHFFGQSSFSTYANVVESSLVPIDKRIPLQSVAFLGCGMQTGAGSILNEMKPPAGSSVAISGTGAVGHAAVMAARVAGCTTIIAIDLHKNRVELAKTIGATHTIHGRSENAKDEVLRITDGKGVDYILDTTGNPDALANLAEALAIRGKLMLVGAAAPGTRVPFEVGGSLTKGWTFKTIVQGGSVPQEFIPRLVELWKQGRFPVDKLVKEYSFEDINKAFQDSESGAVVKPVMIF